jgi:hypothetical protein
MAVLHQFNELPIRTRAIVIPYIRKLILPFSVMKREKAFFALLVKVV